MVQQGGRIRRGSPQHTGRVNPQHFRRFLGGPIKKDKLYYFLNFEMQRTAEAQQETLIVPNAAFRAGSISYYYNNATGGQSVQTLIPGPVRRTRSALQCEWNMPMGSRETIQVFSPSFNEYPLPNGSLAGDGLNTGSFSWAAPNPDLSLDEHRQDRLLDFRQASPLRPRRPAGRQRSISAAVSRTSAQQYKS